MVTSYHHFVCCNNNIYEDDDKLPSSFSSLQHHHKRDDNTLPLCSFQTQRRINTQENKPKKNKKREGAHLQSFVLPLHFWLLLLTFLFQTLFLTFFFSIAPKKKEKKIAKKGWSFPSSSQFALSLLVPTFTLPLLLFCFKRIVFASSSSQTEEKKRKHREEKKCKERRNFPLSSLFALSLWLLLLPFCFKCFSWHFLLLKQKKSTKKQRKKTIKKKKKCTKTRELSFKLPLCPFTFGSHFYPLPFALLFQMFSPSIFFFSNRRKENHKEKKMQRKNKVYL